MSSGNTEKFDRQTPTPSDEKDNDPDTQLKDEAQDALERILTTEYVQKHIDGYTKHKFTGEQLWEAFVDDFFEYKAPEDWHRCDSFTNRALRDMLRANGVYIQKEKGPNTISKHLANLVRSTDFPEWDKSDRDYARVAHILEPFPTRNSSPHNNIADDTYQSEPTKLRRLEYPCENSAHPPVFMQPQQYTSRQKGKDNSGNENNEDWQYNDNVKSRDGIGKNNRQQNHEPLSTIKGDQNQNPPQRSPPTELDSKSLFAPYSICVHTKEIATLERAYPEKLKYRGDGDTFDYKFQIFISRCKQTAVPYQASTSAFPVMLTDMALSFYYTHVDRMPNKTLENLCSSIKDYFENFEYRRNQQDNWHALKLEDIINLNKGKPLSQSLKILIEKIDEMKFGLPVGLNNDEMIHHKIRSACEDHPAFSTVCDRSSPTINGLISDLQTSATKYDRRQRKINNSENYLTDRHYVVNQSRRKSPMPSSTKKQTLELPDGCIVCSKKSCWSKNHPKHEIDEAFRKLKKDMPNYEKSFRQYILEVEQNTKIEQLQKLSDIELKADTSSSDSDEGPGYNRSDISQSCFEQNLCDFFFIDKASLDGPRAIQTLTDRSFFHSLCAYNDKTPSIEQSSTVDLPHDDSVIEAWLLSPRYGNQNFLGVVVDTGAAGYSTGGIQQFHALKTLYLDLVLDTKKACHFKFGKGTATSIGSVEVELPIGPVVFYIVDLDLPFLLSLKDMDNLGVYFNNLKNIICTADHKSVGPHSITRRFGHAFLVWESPLENFITEELTEQELRQLHRRFGHPSIDRLCNLLEKSGREAHRPMIEKLTKHCLSCQKHGASPKRFKFNISDPDIQFNHSVLVDIFYIEGSPIVHVVDEATRFQAAHWLKNLSAQHVWNCIRQCWIDTYLGPPDVISHDAGTQFLSREFKNLAASMGISTESVPVEAHNAIGLVERYHGPLRRAYLIIKEELSSISEISKEMLLQMAVKAVNDSVGPDGLVPTLLVFGTYPRLTSLDPPAPDMITRAKAVQKASNEITKARLNRQIGDALKERNGPRTDAVRNLPINSKVWVNREKEGWTGPWRLLRIDGETCTISMPTGQAKFRTTVVKPYYDPDSDNKEENENIPQIVESPRNAVNEPNQPSPIDDIPLRRNPPRDHHPPARYHQNYTKVFTFFVQNFIDTETLVSEKELYHHKLSNKLRQEGKIQALGLPFEQSRQAELEGLKQREILEIVPRKQATGRIFGLRRLVEDNEISIKIDGWVDRNN